MVEDDTQQEVVKVEENLPTSTDEQSVDILSRIQEIATKEELKEVTNLFNLSITKKEMARALKQDELLDLVLKQAEEKLKKRPEELSTKDILDYMNAFQSNLEKTQNYIDKVEDSPTIQVNDNKKIVVNINALSRDSNENVLDAINKLIANMSDDKSLEDLVNSVEIADIDATEEVDENADE